MIHEKLPPFNVYSWPLLSHHFSWPGVSFLKQSSWWHQLFCKDLSQMNRFLQDFQELEKMFPMDWNPRIGSMLHFSSLLFFICSLFPLLFLSSLSFVADVADAGSANQLFVPTNNVTDSHWTSIRDCFVNKYINDLKINKISWEFEWKLNCISNVK